MTRHQSVLWSLLAVGGVALALLSGFERSSAAQVGKAGPQAEAVKEVHDQFYAALNAMFEGNAEPFEDVWWHTNDVVYMGADGSYNVGWDDVYANWKKQAALNIGGKVEPSNVRYVVGEDVALANQYVTGTNNFNGQPRKIKLRATSVFRQQEGVWKMVCHHVDVIPALDNTLNERN